MTDMVEKVARAILDEGKNLRRASSSCDEARLPDGQRSARDEAFSKAREEAAERLLAIPDSALSQPKTGE